mgnify:FL=1
MASKPIRVQLTRATARYPKGAEFGFESEKDAASVLDKGSFKVISNQDGSPVESPKKAAAEDKK